MSSTAILPDVRPYRVVLDKPVSSSGTIALGPRRRYRTQCDWQPTWYQAEAWHMPSGQPLAVVLFVGGTPEGKWHAYLYSQAHRTMRERHML